MGSSLVLKNIHKITTNVTPRYPFFTSISKNKPRCYPQQRLGNMQAKKICMHVFFQFCGHINGKIIKKPHRRLSRNTALELCPEPPAPEPSRNPWFGTLPRNLPGTGGSEPAPEPSRNLPEPAPGKPPRNRPGAYIGKDPIAKAVGEKVRKCLGFLKILITKFSWIPRHSFKEFSFNSLKSSLQNHRAPKREVKKEGGGAPNPKLGSP